MMQPCLQSYICPYIHTAHAQLLNFHTFGVAITKLGECLLFGQVRRITAVLAAPSPRQQSENMSEAESEMHEAVSESISGIVSVQDFVFTILSRRDRE